MTLKRKWSFGAVAMFALSACSGTETVETADTTSEVEEFAARINGGNAARAQSSQSPTIAPPRANPAPAAPTPETAVNLPSEACGVDRMGQFIGKVADNATRTAVLTAAGGASEVRFILPGSDYIPPNAGNPRLNLILDDQDIIRDARCG